MEAQILFTIGYEGREIDEFIDRLKKYKITRLIDIREIPQSRKKGYSKSVLKTKVESENIQYVHFRSLGSPSKLRHKLKTDKDYPSFFEAYGAYLKNNKDALYEVYELIKNGLNCIMCYEHLPEKCHRSKVVEEIIEINGNSLNILHI